MALSPRDRRAVMILGGVAGAAIVVLVLLSVLRGGGGEEAQPTPVEPGGPTPAPTATATPTPRPTLPPMVLAGSRDPFSIPPALQTPGGGVSPPPGGTGTPTPTPTAPGGGSSTTVGGHTVVLLDIFADGTRAQVEVDGDVFTVSVGETFDDNFRLVSISGECARFVFGDEGFTLCTIAPK